MVDIIDEKEVCRIVKKMPYEIVRDVVCCVCSSRPSSNGRPHWLKYKTDKDGKFDSNGNWDEKSYMCTHCYTEIYKNRPDSFQYFRKTEAKSRKGNFSRFERPGKTVIGQWIAAKTLGLYDLNIYNNNFREPIDLSNHPTYGNIDVKIATYNNVNLQYRFQGIRQNFDYLLTLCMDRYEIWKNVEITHIIPIECINTENITIVKTVSSRRSKWEEFRIDEKPYNDTYHSVDIPEFFSPFGLWEGKYDNIDE